MEHSEEVVGVPLLANDEPAIVVEPGEEPFDLPPAADRTPILRRDFAGAAVSRDQFDAERSEAPVDCQQL
jgi:hypothetical protein